MYSDPRQEQGFKEEFYPEVKESDRPGPADVDAWKARFLAVYARRNACVTTLAQLAPDDPLRPQYVRQSVLLTEAIDHLEDVCMPVGFIAEPTLDDRLFARALTFTHAPISSSPEEEGMSSFSLYIPIPIEDVPLPGGTDAS